VQPPWKHREKGVTVRNPKESANSTGLGDERNQGVAVFNFQRREQERLPSQVAQLKIRRAG
jgi:hypothetical protein